MAFSFFTTGAAKKRRRDRTDQSLDEALNAETAGSGYRDAMPKPEKTLRPIPPKYPHDGNGGFLPRAASTEGAGAPHEVDWSEAGGTGGTGGNAGSGGSSGTNAGTGTGEGQSSFEDYYNRLIAALRSYGINMELPTLEELYDQLAAFLRPSVDSAIAGRHRQGETTLAELDADAYSRGMGGSSYLSGMKQREYDAAASDIAAMETNYNATLAQYLYNASNELADIQRQFEELRRQQEYEMQRLRAQQQHELELARRREEHERALQREREQHELALQRMRAGQSGSGGYGSAQSGAGSAGSGVSHTPGEYRANYNAYTVYLQCVSEEERYSIFHSGSAYWQSIRDDMLSNLTPADYARLRSLFDPGSHGGSGHGGSANGNFGTRPNPMIPERMLD